MTFLTQIYPPVGWKARKGGYDDVNVLIPEPTVQSIKKIGIAYQLNATRAKPMMSRVFKEMALRQPLLSQEEYWGSIEKRKIKLTYGNDVEASLFDEDCEGCIFLDLGPDDISHKDTPIAKSSSNAITNYLFIFVFRIQFEPFFQNTMPCFCSSNYYFRFCSNAQPELKRRRTMCSISTS